MTRLNLRSSFRLLDKNWVLFKTTLGTEGALAVVEGDESVVITALGGCWVVRILLNLDASLESCDFTSVSSIVSDIMRQWGQ